MLTKRISAEKQILIVKTYLHEAKSIRARAKQLGIHYITLWRWVKEYKENGEEGIKRKEQYRRPWNRPSKKLEHLVVFLKENDPSCTVRTAQKILKKQGIKMSIKGVWSIWKRYGLAGFIKKKLSNNFREYISITAETEKGVRKAQELIDKEKLKKASKILNQLPSCGRSDILEKIPDGPLNNKRRLEKLPSCFGKIPYSLYRRKARRLRENFLNKGYYYSAIRAGLGEATALSYLNKPEEQLRLIHDLKKKLTIKKGQSSLPLWFRLNILESIANTKLLQTEKALLSLRKCLRFKRSLSYINFLYDIAILYSYFGYYREMDSLLEKMLPMVTDDEKRLLMSTLAFVKTTRADYRASLKILRKICSGDDTLTFFVKAKCYLGMGRIEQAKEFTQRGLLKAKKLGIKGYINTASIIFAVANSAIGEKEKARLLLLRHINFLKKSGMKKALISSEVILNRTAIPKDAEKIRTIRLSLLFRNAANSGKTSDYKKAYRFANRYKLLGIFHQRVLLIPEPVLAMIEKGKDTGLPRAILNLPVFRKEIPSYYLKFLGHLIVHKDQKYLKMRLTPKDTSFLIFLASSERKSITLNKIYRNFWPHSKNPSRNLAHLLVRIRKALKLPSHYLYVKENRLFYDCYFTTDYGEYQEYIAQAKALLRAEEWGFAKREFNRAFRLFRGEPFRKMYDNWSDDKRLEILFSYETEVLSFAKELKKRGRTEEAEKLLKRAEKIIPYADLKT